MKNGEQLERAPRRSVGWQLKGLQTLAAFETALELIGQPVLVVDRSGHILYANALGEQLLVQDRRGVQRSLNEAARRAAPDLNWRLTPLRGAAELTGFIAVLQAPPANPSPAGAGKSAAAADRWKLTARQADVLGLVAGGLTNATIAESLGIKERTVEFHLSTLFDKAGVDNRATLIVKLLAL